MSRANHKTQIYEKAIEKFSIFFSEQNAGACMYSPDRWPLQATWRGFQDIIRLGNGFSPIQEKGGKEKELPVHHKLEEFLDSKQNR
jgi:hypothetical protein